MVKALKILTIPGSTKQRSFYFGFDNSANVRDIRVIRVAERRNHTIVNQKSFKQKNLKKCRDDTCKSTQKQDGMTLAKVKEQDGMTFAK